MLYRWDDYSLDCKRPLLMQEGRKVEVPRKVLACIAYLAEHHYRAVTHDELILRIWGHRDVSNHQLTQLILSTRRAINDDGQTQRYIRTVSGIGYRWVAPLTESQEPSPQNPSKADAEVSANAPPAATAAQPLSARPPIDHEPSASRPLRTAATFSLFLVVLTVGPNRLEEFSRGKDDSPASPSSSQAILDVDPIGSLRQALFVGKFEVVREGLASLPRDIADGIEARLIDIELDIRRGRYARAAEKLSTQTARADSSGNAVWRARLLILESELNSRLQLPSTDVLTPAQSAVDLLESTDNPPSPEVYANALWHRANGYILSDRFEEAQRDLIGARDIYQRTGDGHRNAEVRASFARVRMRTGDLSGALTEMQAVAEDFTRYDDKTREVFARNTMTKIQIEMLRWEDALESNSRSIELLKSIPESERRYPTLQLRALALTGYGRLREAASLLEDAESANTERRDYIIPAIHYLEAGDARAALEAATREFGNTKVDTRSNLVFENKDGAILFWVMSAQALVAEGEALPSPTKEQLAWLNAPQSATARTARGRWLLVNGRVADAEIELRRAMQEFSATNQLFRMVLTAESLVEISIRRGDPASAREILTSLRARDPEYVDRDYRTSLMRLKLAISEKDAVAAELAYRNTVASGRERRPPDALLSAYRRFETGT